jgi:hypothetical protein
VVLDNYVAMEPDESEGPYTIPIFAKTGKDGSWWGPLLEKLWAKVNGNYELTAAGWPHEALRCLSGAPAVDHLIIDKSLNEIWEIVKDADDKGYLMGAGTAGQGDDRK